MATGDPASTGSGAPAQETDLPAGVKTRLLPAEAQWKALDFVPSALVPPGYEEAAPAVEVRLSEKLWRVADAHGEERVCLFGSIGGAPPAFYPADPDGRLVVDGEPVPPATAAPAKPTGSAAPSPMRTIFTPAPARATAIPSL
jgi:hypothetical protein